MSTDYFLFLRAAEMQTFFGKGLFNVHAAVRQRPLAIEIVGMPLEKFQLLEFSDPPNLMEFWLSQIKKWSNLGVKPSKAKQFQVSVVS